MAENLEKVEVINIDTVNAIDSIKGLKDVIKTLREQLSDCTIGSEEFKDTLETLTVAQNKLKSATKTSNETLEGSYDSLVKKMAELKQAWRATASEADRAVLADHIADINSQLKEMDASIGNYQRNVGNYASAFDDLSIKIENGCAKFENINKVSRSVIGSFDLVEGGLKAIGVESQAVTTLMDSMQGAMKFTSGLDSVKEGVQAFTKLSTTVKAATSAQWLLNAAQMANPIGILVGLIATLVAGIAGLISWIGKNREEEEQLRAAFEATNKVIEQRVQAQELEIQLMEARGEAQADILAKEKEYAELNLQTTKNRIAALEKELEETGALRFKKKSLLEEQLQDLKDSLKEQEDAVRLANNAILIYETKTAKEAADKEKEIADEKVRQRLEEQKKLEEAAKRLADKQIEEAKRAKEEIAKLYKTLDEELADYGKSPVQLKFEELNEWYKAGKETLKQSMEEGVISEEEYQQKLDRIREVYQAKKKDVYAEADKWQEEQLVASGEHVVEATKKQEEAYGALGLKIKETGALTAENQKIIASSVNLVGQTFGQVGQLLTTLANSQDKSSKKGFETAKKLSIAAATMQTFQGIISAWTSAMQLPPPISFITGGIMTAFTSALGALQISQIQKQKFDGSSSLSGSNVSAPTVNTSALLSTPVNYTTEVQGASAVDNAMDSRVYVVESDITDTVNKVKTTEEESTF